MLDTTKLYIVEWSPSAKEVNIEILSEVVSNNIIAVGEYKKTKFIPDYVLVGVTDSEQEAIKIADRIEKEFK